MRLFYSRLLPRHFVAVSTLGVKFLVPYQRQGWLKRYGETIAPVVPCDVEIHIATSGEGSEEAKLASYLGMI